jgi:hypothetical protein
MRYKAHVEVHYKARYEANWLTDLAGRLGRQKWPADLAGRLGLQTLAGQTCYN